MAGNKISTFKNQYDFLSNFYPAEIKVGNLVFPTVEHAFQAYKCRVISDRQHFTNPNLSPGKAKKLGKHVDLRPDWDQVKVSIMYWLVHEKFDKNMDLKLKLLNTGNTELVEGNNWGDTFWGVCQGVGENNLGKILMEVRKELRERKAG